MEKFTPAPWEAHETRVYFPDLRGGFDLRDCPNPEANARLIAMAPELLAALKESVEFAQQELKEIGGCDHSVGICVCGIVRMVDAWNELIAKAEGQ